MEQATEASLLDVNLVIKQFFEDPNWTSKTALGGMFLALSILLLTLSWAFCLPLVAIFVALVFGYWLRCIKEQGFHNLLPEWVKLYECVLFGLAWLAVQCVLLLLQAGIYAAIFTLAGAQAFRVTGTVGNGNDMVFSMLPLVVALMVVFILVLFFDFVTPLLMTNFAYEENFLAGFAFRKILSKVASSPRDFLCAWLLSLGLKISSIMLPLVTVVGVFFIPSTFFVAQVITCLILAQIWNEPRVLSGEKIEL